MTSAKSLAEQFSLTLVGPNNELSDLCSLDDPKTNGLGFLRSKSLPTPIPKIGALLVSEGIELPIDSSVSFLVTKDPLLAFSKIVPLFRPPFRPNPGIHPTAVVSDSVSLGKNVSIGAYSVIQDNCKVGDDTIIHPHVVIYPDCEIGKGVTVHSQVTIREGTKIKDLCTIQPGSVLGADGFGYVLDPSVGLVPVPQVGNVVLEERVDIGANTCLDRGTIGETKIGFGTKIDNLVQIGHNVKIGSHAILCGQSGIGGSSTLGDKVVLGGQVGVADHITLPSETRIAASSAVITKIDEKGDYCGFPAIKATTWKRLQVTIRKLAK